jgi:hypothetical protein
LKALITQEISHITSGSGRDCFGILGEIEPRLCHVEEHRLFIHGDGLLGLPQAFCRVLPEVVGPHVTILMAHVK